MNGDICIDGVLIPPLLLWALVAMFLGVPLRRCLAELGVYRFVWHRALFDVALFAILLNAIDVLASHWSLS